MAEEVGQTPVEHEGIMHPEHIGKITGSYPVAGRDCEKESNMPFEITVNMGDQHWTFAVPCMRTTFAEIAEDDTMKRIMASMAENFIHQFRTPRVVFPSKELKDAP